LDTVAFALLNSKLYPTCFSTGELFFFFFRFSWEAGNEKESRAEALPSSP
jgi:hypothetical protein